ncbi:hypothetical protein [Aridibaculum aurantiacum]|uniref:hypothetical protein n=1 Tax=Aridibaculum aurantiacum TaxID=2810307 RepID=UPI001A969004|nr:hypothetical protein [Aridibaculum aurantiacum]
MFLKPLFLVALCISSLLCQGQKLGIFDFVIGRPLPADMHTLYDVKNHPVQKEVLLVKGRNEKLRAFHVELDSVQVKTDQLGIIKEITVSTPFVHYADNIRLDFDWELLLQELKNEFGAAFTVGRTRTNGMVAIWLFQQNVHLSVSIYRVFPKDENKERRFVLHWESKPTPLVN